MDNTQLFLLSDAVRRYAAGLISFEEYRNFLANWWQSHKETWQESNLLQVFLLSLGHSGTLQDFS